MYVCTINTHTHRENWSCYSLTVMTIWSRLPGLQYLAEALEQNYSSWKEWNTALGQQWSIRSPPKPKLHRWKKKGFTWEKSKYHCFTLLESGFTCTNFPLQDFNPQATGEEEKQIQKLRTNWPSSADRDGSIQEQNYMGNRTDVNICSCLLTLTATAPDSKSL